MPDDATSEKRFLSRVSPCYPIYFVIFNTRTKVSRVETIFKPYGAFHVVMINIQESLHLIIRRFVECLFRILYLDFQTHIFNFQFRHSDDVTHILVASNL